MHIAPVLLRADAIDDLRLPQGSEGGDGEHLSLTAGEKPRSMGTRKGPYRTFYRPNLV
ncbi:MAG: hypothetical protein DDT26_02261 [Dehalococcoidia bacterium]|nr:hypothetical protein [Chloroflexota bacterium]